MIGAISDVRLVSYLGKVPPVVEVKQVVNDVRRPRARVPYSVQQLNLDENGGVDHQA